MLIPSKQDVSRFWEKVEKTDTCWLFHSSLAKGYGRFAIDSQVYLAHRVSYLIATGDDPGPLMVLHRCDNPRCVRPDHLFLGTRADNNKDMFTKGRGRPRGGEYPRGEHHHLARLSEALVVELRSLHADGVPVRELARRFGIPRPTLRSAVLGRTWCHVGAAVAGARKVPPVQRSEDAETA